MKRLVLATTAVIALSAPALAQSDAERAVSDALMTRGFSAASIATLTDAQISQLYIALTSENYSDVDTIIAGLDLPEDSASAAFSDTPADDNTLAVVAEALTEAGYPDGTVTMLSDAQVAELYLVATSEEESDIAATIDGFGLDDMAADRATTPNAVSEADMYVMTELNRRGVTQTQIEALGSADLTELYVVLTSGDENEIRQAIASAVDS